VSDIAALVSDNLDLWTSAVERKSGAGRGGSKKISLYGIERLRALILDLAVRGKLVPQDAGDEPAAKLLARIRSSKPAYLVEHDLPKQRALAGPVGLGPFELPDNWAWTRLGDIAAYIQRGKSPKYSDGSGFFVVSQRCVQWAGLDLSVAKEISQASLGSYEPYRFLRQDDLLWNSTGTGTIGRVIALADVPDGLVCDSHVTLVRCPWVNALYLRSWLASDAVYGQIEVLAAGSTNQIEWTAQLATAQLVPLPPLAEQQRIVAKVDELMALCDALEAQSASTLAAHQTLVETLLGTLVNSADAADLATNWTRLETHFDTLFTTEASIEALKQTVVELAVRGLLVSQHPDEKALQHPNGKWGKPTSAPFPLPSNWYCLPLTALGDVRGGGTPSKARSDYWDGPLPWVSPKDMKQDYLSDAQLHVSESALAGSAIKLIPPRSILFVVRGMILAHSFPVGISKTDLTINQDMKALILHVPEMDEYLLRALKGLKREILTRIERSSHGTCRLDSKDYASLPIPIPPLAEQHRIVARVDELMALCDALKARISDAAETQKHLADAIVERAAA
jgi:type I restriction enzyme, S subunit